MQSAFHAVEAAAQACANTEFTDQFPEQAYRLLIDKLRAACQHRLRLVHFCLAYCASLEACQPLLVLAPVSHCMSYSVLAKAAFSRAHAASCFWVWSGGMKALLPRRNQDAVHVTVSSVP